MTRRLGMWGSALLAVALVAPWVPSPVAASPSTAARPTVLESTTAPGSTTYQSLAPARLADTRKPGDGGYTWISSNTIRVPVAGIKGVPANAQAAVLNLTIVDNAGLGFLTVYPAGSARPTASNVNADRINMIIANMATVQLGAGGAVDIYMHMPTNVVVDVTGAYVPTSVATQAGRLQTRESGSFRVLDTRDTNYYIPPQTSISVDTAAAGVSPNASAVVVNITSVWGGLGYWNVYPNGGDPTGTSTLNIDRPWQVRAAQAIVRLTPGARTFNVYSLGGGYLVVDVAGWFTGEGDGLSTDGQFVPRSPLRVVDTRNSYSLPPWGRSTITFGVGSPAGATAAAVAVNLTGTESWDEGFVTAHPAGQPRPNSSNLNFAGPANTVANHAISRVGVGGLSLYTQNGGHLIADVAGWYVGASSPTITSPPPNPFYWPNPAVRVVVPKIGVDVAIATGSNLDLVADLGYAATFPSMINVATPGNMMLFGHRTKGSAPFRRLNEMNPGDVFTIYGSDGHIYNYRVTRLDITGPTYDAVYARAVDQGLITAQLVACHPPGSVAYRIVVTGRLISVG